MRTSPNAPAVRLRPPASAMGRRSSPARRSAIPAPDCISRSASSRALYQRTRTGRGQKVLCAMQDGVLNLARVKLRDQQRLAHGPLAEYSQYGEGVPFGESGAARRQRFRRRPARLDPQVQGLGDRPERLHLFHHPGAGVGPICDVIGKPEWKTDPDYATPPARLPRLQADLRHDRAMDHDQDQVRGHGDPATSTTSRVGPILSMKEIAAEPSLRATGTVVEVDHPAPWAVSDGGQSDQIV